MLVHVEDVNEYSGWTKALVADIHHNNATMPGRTYSMVCFRDVTCPNCGNECVLVDYWQTPNPDWPRVCNRCEEVMDHYARMDEDAYDDDEYFPPYDYDYDEDEEE